MLLVALCTSLLLLFPGQAVGHGEVDNYGEDVEGMYLAYYGRPGDPGGVDYWAQRLDEAGGGFHEIIDEFGTSEEYTVRFGNLTEAVLVAPAMPAQ